MMKHHDQGGEFFHLHFLSQFIIKKVKIESHTRQKLEGGADAEPRRALLTVLLLTACSACFPAELRTTNPGMAPLKNGLGNIQLRKRPMGLPTAWSYEDIFLIEDPSSQMMSGCVTLT